MSFFGPPDINKLQTKRDIDGLIKCLEHQKENPLRVKAAAALGEIGDEKAVQPLINILNDSDIDVKQAVISALGKIRDPRAVKPLVEIISSRKSTNGKFIQRELEEQALLNIGDLGTDQLIECLIPDKTGHNGSNIAREKNSVALAALTRIGDLRAVRHLIQYLSIYPSGLERGKVAWALGEIGDQSACPALIESLKDYDYPCRTECAKALIKMHQKPEDIESKVRFFTALGDAESIIRIGAPAVETLISMIGLNYEESISTIAIALGRIGDPRAVRPLIGIFEWQHKMIGLEVDKQFMSVVDALAEIGAPAVDELVDVLNRVDDPYNQTTFLADGASCVLLKMGEPRAIAPLIRMLQFGGSASAIAVERLAKFGQLARGELLAERNQPSHNMFTSEGVEKVLKKMGEFS